MSKYLSDYMAEKEKEFMRHVRPEVKARIETDKPICLAEYNNLRMNSYEQKLYQQLLDDNAFIEIMESYMKQYNHCKLGKFELPHHYQEAVDRQFLPELIKRFKALI